MSFETVAANDEALKLLAVEPGDRVLEVGFGHGRTLERVAAMARDGFVAGIDASEEMVSMATRRCRRLVHTGRVRLARGDSAAIAYPDSFFDKALGIHTIYFWADPASHLRELRRVLRAGGRLVIGFRPKDDAASTDFPDGVYTFYARDDVRCMLEQSGFTEGQVYESAAGVVFLSATA